MSKYIPFVIEELIIVDNFFEQDDLYRCVEYAKSITSNRIVEDAYFAQEIWSRYSTKLQEINSEWTGLYQEITLTNSKKPISRHLDKKRGDASQKLLIYLNNLDGGGTLFYIDDRTLLVENKQNRLVCFDIKIEHEGQIFSGDRKLAIGFRPQISNKKI